LAAGIADNVGGPRRIVVVNILIMLPLGEDLHHLKQPMNSSSLIYGEYDL
jgi:hypothetical protein